MEVVVEMLTGPLFHVRLPDGATVSDLKKEISAQEKLPLDRLILMVDGDGDGDEMNRLMCEDDEATLTEYGVVDGSHVYIFFTFPDKSNDENEDRNEKSSPPPPNQDS